VGRDNLARYKFENYLKEIFVDSDTKVALLSGAPFDDPTWDLLTNDQIAAARTSINKFAGSRRLLGHSVFTPKKQGWMEEVDRAIATIKPDSWKGYTIGDPLFPSKLESYWWLDDDKLVYPFYEKAVKSGITTICIHKGLLPADYETSWPKVWSTRPCGTSARPQGLAEAQLHHVPRRAPAVPRETRRGARRVRADRPHQVGDRPGRDPEQTRREERLRRGRHRVRDVRRRQPAVRRGLHRHSGEGARRRPRHLGHGFTSGTARPSGRSRRCAGSRSARRTCRRSTASSRWAPPTAQ